MLPTESSVQVRTIQGLPHVRGGVSYVDYNFTYWYLVFPTCVGVFLRQCRIPAVWLGLPHVRGGVSPLQIIAMVAVTSSPRTWGCFLQRQGG